MQDTLDALVSGLLNCVAAFALVSGIFFMFVGALGVLRLPDFYTRNHAASKCITLGVSGLLMALVLHLAGSARLPGPAQQRLEQEAAVEVDVEAPITAAVTKALLVVVFVFVSAPVGSHMLARAAHLAGVGFWKGTLSDELAEDRSPDDARR